MKKLIALLGLLPALAFAAASTPSAPISEIQILENPGFEAGKATYSNSGGTFTLDTSTPLLGKASAVFTASGASQTLDSKLYPVATGSALVGNQCKGKITYTTSASVYSLQLVDNTATVIGLTALPVVSVPTDAFVTAPCPAAGSSFKLEIMASGSGAAIELDGLALGKFALGLPAASGLVGSKTIGGLLFQNFAQVTATVQLPGEDVAYSPTLGMYAVASSAGSTSDIATSLDGITWTQQTITPTSGMHRVVWASALSLFVAVGDSGAIISSSDGVTWVTRTDPNSGAAYKGLVWSSTAGLFVAVSSNGKVASSSNGTTWTLRTPSAANDWRSVTYGNGLFVAVGKTSGTGNQVMTSPDGITWSAATSSFNAQWTDVTYGNGLYVAIATNHTATVVMTSPDGTTWTSRVASAGTADLFKIIYIPDFHMFAVSVGPSGLRLTSFDGINWTTKQDVTTGNHVYGMVWDPDRGVIVGGSDVRPLLSNILGTGWNL